MSNFLLANDELILRLFLAVLLGLIIGIERLLVHKEAGMKTHALVSMGACLFVLVSEALSQKYAGHPGFNPAQIASNIVVGIGFLGAGSIIHNGSRLTGLTTAGGLWVTAGIGMASGFGFYNLAMISTILVLFVLVIINIFEQPLRKISGDIDTTQ
jgi:putative Mg2+ transporter-C (MgtC) family protein